jgi:O-6-methylguanine DNA methyltransferase
MIFYKILSTPIGEMLAAESDSRLCLLEFADNRSPKTVLRPLERKYGREMTAKDTPLLKTLDEQLSSYFDGKSRNFDLPLSFAGTDFQNKVWKRLCQIPYGQTVNYGWIAAKIGCPDSSRAVGRANGANPIAIVVPCHRVIGRDGQLVGYGGRLWRKKWLLEHEGALQGESL